MSSKFDKTTTNKKWKYKRI